MCVCTLFYLHHIHSIACLSMSPIVSVLTCCESDTPPPHTHTPWTLPLQTQHANVNDLDGENIRFFAIALVPFLWNFLIRRAHSDTLSTFYICYAVLPGARGWYCLLQD
jgi:hypothetical protein